MGKITGKRNKVVMGWVTAMLVMASAVHALEKTSGGANLDQSIRTALEANLKLTEAKVEDLEAKVEVMKACARQSKMYTPSGCKNFPPRKQSCTCGG